MEYHIRRRDKEIASKGALKKILKSAKYVTLALSKNNKPYLVSLSYGYDEESNRLYFHCAKEGKKLDYLRSNNSVWGQVMIDHGYVSDECNHLFASVHFSGKVTFIDDTDQKRAAIEYMIKHLNGNPENLLSKFNRASLKDMVIFAVDINFMSGKKSKQVVL